MNRMSRLVNNYKVVLVLFAALVIVDTISAIVENVFLVRDYPTVVDSFELSVQNVLQMLWGHSLHAVLHLLIFVLVSERVGKQALVVPLCILSGFLLNLALSFVSYSHILFDLRAFNWLGYLFYVTALFLVADYFIKRRTTFYHAAVAYYLLFLANRAGGYLAIILLSGHVMPFLNEEFYRFIVYAIAFGGLFVFIGKVLLSGTEK